LGVVCVCFHACGENPAFNVVYMSVCFITNHVCIAEYFLLKTAVSSLVFLTTNYLVTNQINVWRRVICIFIAPCIQNEARV